MPRKLKFKTKVKRFHKKYGKYFLKIGLPVLTIFSLVVPVFFVQALIVDETKVTYVTKPFKLSPANGYRDIGGQPTGAGSWNSSGKPGDYPESSCLPILATVKHTDANTGDVIMAMNYDYKHNGNPTDVVGFDHLEKVTTAATTVTNLNQLNFSLADFTAATSFKSAGADINAQVSGPYGGDGSLAENPAVAVNDTKRHYDVLLYNVPRDTEVYVLLCARLGPDSGEFPGGSMQVGAGNGHSNINPGDILLLPSITINGTVTSGTATSDQWTYTVNPAIGGQATYSSSSSHTISNISPDGRYAISASGPFGYTLTGISGTNCEAVGLTASTTVRAGDPAVDGICNFTFAPVSPNLTVTPTIINDDGGPATTADLALLIDGGGADFDTLTALAPGLHQVTPSITVPGYVRTIAGDCASDGSITLANGDNKICEVTFDDMPATLNVIKRVNNTYGGTKVSGDFMINVYQGGELPVSSFPGSLTAIAVDLNPGAYSVSEDAVSGYVGSLDDGCAGTIQNGEVRNCTITNSDIAPPPPGTGKVTVITNVTNNWGGLLAPADFTMEATGTPPVSLVSFPGVGASGQDVTFGLGPYNIFVSNRPDGYSLSMIGDDFNCVGNIAEGDIKTCTATFADVAGKLTVMVNVNGGTKNPGDFIVQITATNPSTSTFNGSGTGTLVQMNTGSYTAVANADGEYNMTSDNCSGSINLDENRTCTITETYNGSVTPPGPFVTTTGTINVVVNVTNDDGDNKVPGDFTVQVTAVNPSATTFSGSAGTAVTVDAGAYSVDALPVNVYAKNLSAECSGTIAAGETKNCTITEDDQLLIISDITTSTVSDTAVQVNWRTNHPATSRVVYGLVSVPNLPEFDQAGNYGYELSTTEDETLTETHSVIVTGLTPNTVYYLRPVSHGSPEVTGDEVSISTASTPVSSGGGTTYSSSYTSPSGGGSSAPPSTPAPVVIPLALAPQAVLGTKIEAPEEVAAPQAVLGFTTLPNTGGPSNVLAYAVFGLILQAAGIVAVKKASRLTKA